MVFVFVQDEIAWLQFARYKDFEGFYGFIRAFEGFCGLEQVFQGISASWNRNHNIYSIIYPIESGDLISIISDLQECTLCVHCTLYRYSKCTDCLRMWEFDISHVKDEISHSDAKVYWFAFLYINFGPSYISSMSQFELKPISFRPYDMDEYKFNLYRPWFNLRP